MKHTEGKLEIKPGIGLSRVLFFRDSKGVNIGGVVDIDYNDELKDANAQRIVALWNAAPEDTKEAVRYLEHGAEVVKVLKLLRKDNPRGTIGRRWIDTLFAKLEGI